MCRSDVKLHLPHMLNSWNWFSQNWVTFGENFPVPQAKLSSQKLTRLGGKIIKDKTLVKRPGQQINKCSSNKQSSWTGAREPTNTKKRSMTKRRPCEDVGEANSLSSPGDWGFSTETKERRNSFSQLREAGGIRGHAAIVIKLMESRLQRNGEHDQC